MGQALPRTKSTTKPTSTGIRLAAPRICLRFYPIQRQEGKLLLFCLTPAGGGQSVNSLALFTEPYSSSGDEKEPDEL